MKEKLTFAECKEIKKKVAESNQKELTHMVRSLYDVGYEDGYNACKMEGGKIVDFDLIKLIISKTVGVGDTLYNRICENIDNLLFENIGREVEGGSDNGMS